MRLFNNSNCSNNSHNWLIGGNVYLSSNEITVEHVDTPFPWLKLMSKLQSSTNHSKTRNNNCLQKLNNYGKLLLFKPSRLLLKTSVAGSNPGVGLVDMLHQICMKL